MLRFSWDRAKERLDVARPGVDFTTAQRALANPKALVFFAEAHSDEHELRWWLLGQVDGRILPVRHTHRAGGVIRLSGAGYWRQGRDIDETYWQDQGRAEGAVVWGLASNGGHALPFTFAELRPSRLPPARADRLGWSGL